ncbi:MAG TPA: gliding motility-associated C-terminal domain-containing protein, partial [Hymenobacter sp.]|nr:gliding motility-associated C-terminal domain-containing protein [Hymenobacter sp.]
EEYRNGVKIGEVRRDFQLLVVDCPPATTPSPAVQVQNRPINLRSITLCQGDSALMQATLDPTWNYQWRRDGINLPNATESSLMVRESGDYTVLVSPKKACSKVGSSETISVNVIGKEASLREYGHLCATSGLVNLTVTGEAGVTYQWYQDNRLLAGEVADSISITQPGRYRTVLTYTAIGCTVASNTLAITRSAPVQATVKSETGLNRLCPQGSLSLEGSGGMQYVWQKDGQEIQGATAPQYATPNIGTYRVMAIDGFGCRGVSAPFVVVAVSPVTVHFDSIPGVCGPNVPAYTLRGRPSGGLFAGPGVTNDQFSPQQAGVGNHPLTYTVRPAPECAGVTATRMAVVAPIPTIQLPDTLITYRGNTLPISPVYSGNPISYRWSPPTDLDDPSASSPAVLNIAQDITYTIDVANQTGCTARDSIHFIVYAKVWLPEAFSPNGDGLNDVWVLPGIEAFPEAKVTIFNRWGEVIFQSDKGYTRPFDGTAGGTHLPAGLYPYTLHTVPDRPVQRGSVVLVR